MTQALFCTRLPRIAAALLLACSPLPGLAQGLSAAVAEPAAASVPAADRADILAMAGDYRVRFDMQESTAWLAGYTPLDAKISGGYESVRVIADDGDTIVLQHLLVVEHDGQTHVIKHWRQDWQYEPERILAYRGNGRWEWEAVPEESRKGRWSQTVYQVDDSPRYSGWGRWETQGGIRRWRSSWTWRPLARRDAVRAPAYDRYLSINRHQPTPDGWIHWQDNIKLGPIDGELRPVVQEYVLNTYTRFNGYPVHAADDYWAATQGYWQAVRAKWEAIAAAKGGIAIQEEAETGTVISGQLLSWADDILHGHLTEADAVSQAHALMDAHTGQL